jgi:drug/metabolite transporter (DMT)-like permease
VLGLVLGLVGVSIFGVTLPMMRIAVADMSVIFMTAGRAAGAGLIALMLLIFSRSAWPSGAEFWRLCLISMCLVAAFPGFSALAMQTVPASQGGVVLAVLPLGTALAATMVAHERPSRLFWGLALVGSGLVLSFVLGNDADGFRIGYLFLLMAAVWTALGYALSGAMSRDRQGWEVISWALVIALPLSVPLTWFSLPADPAGLPVKAWIAFAYLTLMSQFIGFFAWNAGLAMGGVARVGQVQLLQTFVTLGVSVLLLGESIDQRTGFYALAVVAVVFAGRYAPVRRRA